MTISTKESYTAADNFPTKLAQDYKTIKKIVEDKYITPVHLQLCLTNKCTRNCNFCSCSNRDKSASLAQKQFLIILETFYKLGCESVTITGGGEPLCHPDIINIIKLLYTCNIEIGMVTNADLIHTIPKDVWNLVTWCRISCSDEYKTDRVWLNNIKNTIMASDKVDWAFSYVVTKIPDLKNLREHVNFAEEVGMTHVRIVSDILDYSSIPDVDIDSSIVIRQKRNKPRTGNGDCWLSLLKPVIDVTGRIFPCCGVMYAEEKSSRDFTESMCMGTIEDAKEIWLNQRKFDGFVCYNCYYTDYNDFLSKLLLDLDHRKFI
uniref:Putative radical SAM superfamily protein n=1 Tax=viral metagenome TaxID=1070528 RepID=A0A6M3XJ97_9ZZZZ